jgi:hypothetical protein
MATLRKNEVGVPIKVNTSIDLITATVKKLLVNKPRGGFTEWTGVTVDGTSIVYVTKGGDLDQVGDYKIAAHVEFAGGIQRRGATAHLIVKEVFDE